MSTPAGIARLRPGRPAERWLDEHEIAALASLSVPLIRRHLRAASPFFCHAKKQPDGTWRAPERDVRAFLNARAERHFSIAEAADLLSLGYKWTSELVRRGVIPSRRILGKVRISETALNTLPADLPDAMRRPALRPPV